jgi:cytochrome c-type biogenesis protein CcmH
LILLIVAIIARDVCTDSAAPLPGGEALYKARMTLWLAFALMTAAAIYAVLWPLSRHAAARGGSDVAVYRDQLDEIARDRASGLIGEAEAQAAKVEVSRRLIAAADAAEKSVPASAGSSLWRRRATAAAGLVLLPVGAVALYLMVGSPQLPGEPLQARLRAIHNDRSIAALVKQVEDHLAQHPDDARGYAVLAPVYLQLGRFAEAVQADRKVLALAGETAERQADLGEALTAQANGVVTEEAKSAFARALKLDANDPKAEFFAGVAAVQDGDRNKASTIWHAMLEKAPPNAPWVATVSEALSRLGGKAPPLASTSPAAGGNPPGPSAADVAAASKLSAQDRDVMVRGMVAQLADRLKRNGDDVEGWQRLLRAYIVLNERDKAHAAAEEARRALAKDPDKLRRIEDVIKGLGIES